MAVTGHLWLLLLCLGIHYSTASVCRIKPCDIRTSMKVSVFSDPPLNRESSGLECSYNVEINNNNVCQMRIDFETFNLAPPTTIKPVKNVKQRPGYTCRNDILKVSNKQPKSDILPSLCGENSGQHLYVRVNASINNTAIRIHIKMANRKSHPNLPQATWKIKVTQLECFNTLGIYSDDNSEAITSLASSTPSTSSADRDEYLIAPPGCLQFYPDPSGVFESFNYNRGGGPYLANLDYAACFRRTPDVRGLQLIAEVFEMALRSEDNLHLDTDCQGNVVSQGANQSEDYLFIPAGETSDGLRGSKFCGRSAANRVVTTSPGGPLYVNFHSDDLVTDGLAESSYKFIYKIITT